MLRMFPAPTISNSITFPRWPPRFRIPQISSHSSKRLLIWCHTHSVAFSLLKSYCILTWTFLSNANLKPRPGLSPADERGPAAARCPAGFRAFMGFVLLFVLVHCFSCQVSKSRLGGCALWDVHRAWLTQHLRPKTSVPTVQHPTFASPRVRNPERTSLHSLSIPQGIQQPSDMAARLNRELDSHTLNCNNPPIPYTCTLSPTPNPKL